MDQVERLNDVGIPDRKGHPPTSHVEGLGVGVKLDPDLLGTRCLHEGDRGLAIKANCPVGKVGDHANLVFLAQATNSS